MIDFLLLGTGGHTPLPDRWLSSLLVRCGGELTLFDCGEGTQVPWVRFGWGFRRLAAICLTHNHADHVAGLPGVLHAVANANRTEPLAIYGPAGTARVVSGLRVIAPALPYEVVVREVAPGEQFPLPGGLHGCAEAGDHWLPVLAYRVEIERARRFLPERAIERGIPVPFWRPLQRGEPVRWANGSATPEEVLGPTRRGLAFGFVTDTRPMPAFPGFLDGADLLVCEGTYGDSADLDKAAYRKHMTFAEAATIARDAGAGALWLTHFSPALADPDAFRAEASAIFPNVTVGYSGLTTSLTFQDDG